ncbi:MAG: hypothetical protein EOO41_05735, partial [Methanobacteriota archaeon]
MQFAIALAMARSAARNLPPRAEVGVAEAMESAQFYFDLPLPLHASLTSMPPDALAHLMDVCAEVGVAALAFANAAAAPSGRAVEAAAAVARRSPPASANVDLNRLAFTSLPNTLWVQLMARVARVVMLPWGEDAGAPLFDGWVSIDFPHNREQAEAFEAAMTRSTASMYARVSTVKSDQHAYYSAAALSAAAGELQRSVAKALSEHTTSGRRASAAGLPPAALDALHATPSVAMEAGPEASASVESTSSARSNSSAAPVIPRIALRASGLLPADAALPSPASAQPCDGPKSAHEQAAVDDGEAAGTQASGALL